MAGMTVVFAPHLNFIDVEHHLDGRIMSVPVTLNSIMLNAFSCHAPHEEYATSSKEAFHNSLQKAISDVKKSHPSFKLVICGDFNATIGSDCIPNKYNGQYNDIEHTTLNVAN